MHRLFRAVFGRDLFDVREGTYTGAKNECSAMLNSANAVIRGKLGQDEQLLWSAQPRGGVAFRSEDFFLVPFSLLWGGFAIFWEWGVTTSGAGLFFQLWGIPFVAVGLYMIVGRFAYDAWLRSKTFYGLTNERAVIVRRTFGEVVRSIPLASLGDYTLSVGNDKTGTITFGNGEPSYYAMLAPWRGDSTRSAPRFELIDGAQGVYDQIRDAQRVAQAS
jgi:hypothetical protein